MEKKDDSMSSRRDSRGSSGRRSGVGGTVAVEYETKIRESQTRLSKYTAENDRLLDEVSNLRLQMREMKNDRNELVRAHQESMSLLAQVSEEKLVEFKSQSDQEALESKSAQEEALRTVLEMMEKDCEDRVAELDAELARVEEERERATNMQGEAAAKAAEEEDNKREFEDAARLAIEKLVIERQSRSAEVQNLEARENQLKRELEMTKQRAETDKRAAIEAAAAASSAAAVQQNNFNADDGGSSYTGSNYSDPDDRTSNAGDSSTMSPLLQDQRSVSSDASSHRPPVIVHRRSMHKHSESPFLDDHTFEMTRGRRIALALQSMGWYQPRNGKHWDTEGLGLQSAWCFFEHSVLPRYIVRNHDGSIPLPDDSRANGRVSVYESETGSSAGGSHSGRDDDSDVDDWLDRPKAKAASRPDSPSQRPPRFGLQNGDLSRAEPGESRLPTRLYSPFFTPLSQLGDFGIGIGLYFSSLRAIAFIALIAGCINIPNILYFAGEDYSASQPGVSTLLKGSAICTEQVWVPCPTCDVEDFGQARDRIAGAATVTPDGELQTLVFAKKNTCDGATMMVGICNMASLGFILLAVVILSIYQRRKQIEFDEQEQTAQDYSIEISNPPEDATEPEEWKEFFETRFGGHMTCCTVAIDNGLLVKALAERREVLFQIEEQLKEGASVNTLTLSELAAKIEHGRTFLGKFKSRMSPDIPELVGRLTVLNTRIQGLAQQEYRATRVFCTFETEGAQRHVLQKMSVGSFVAYRNDTHQVNPNLLFRGEHVLLVREAEEPSTIRWMDLDEKWITKLKQISITTAISLGSIVIVAAIVALLRRKSAAYAAVGISIANALFPSIAKILTNMEAHPSETGKQSSLFVKIAIFRWVVTAIVITIITPFTSTLTNGPAHLIQSIYVIFFSDLVTTNVIQLLDPVSNFKRHFLAPRASSQERMNLLMGGTEYTVAERYTNTTKTLFLTFYYCAIFPSAFFMCAFTLIVNFYVDKFSLMRTWKPAPALGPYIAKFSRVYFMSSAIAAMALISSYLYSGFPFDNLCGQDVSHSAYYGTWKITNGEGVDSTAIIEPGVRSFHYCNQFLGPGSNFAFPALPIAQTEGSIWMTNEQQDLTNIYGWLSVGVIGFVGLAFLFEALKAVRSFFGGSYKVKSGVFLLSLIQIRAVPHTWNDPRRTGVFTARRSAKWRPFHRTFLKLRPVSSLIHFWQ